MPPLPNYPEFFTRRERALLGARFEELLTPALPLRDYADNICHAPPREL